VSQSESLWEAVALLHSKRHALIEGPFAGATIEEGQTMSDCGIEEGARLHVVLCQTLADQLLDCQQLRGKIYTGPHVAGAVAAGAWGDLVRLVEAGSDLDSSDGGTGFGYNPLMVLASVPGDSDLASIDPEEAAIAMKYLLQHGAAVNATDNSNKTALHICGKYGGHIDQLLALLEGGADVNWEEDDYLDRGYTPLWYVRNYKRPMHEQAAKELEKRGAYQQPRLLESDYPKSLVEAAQSGWPGAR